MSPGCSIYYPLPSVDSIYCSQYLHTSPPRGDHLRRVPARRQEPGVLQTLCPLALSPGSREQCRISLLYLIIFIIYHRNIPRVKHHNTLQTTTKNFDIQNNRILYKVIIIRTLFILICLLYFSHLLFNCSL